MTPDFQHVYAAGLTVVGETREGEGLVEVGAGAAECSGVDGT
ncbi:hypothetical protein [Streptomyces sp. NPDC051546]